MVITKKIDRYDLNACAHQQNPLQPERRRLDHPFGLLAPVPTFWPALTRLGFSVYLL